MKKHSSNHGLQRIRGPAEVGKSMKQMLVGGGEEEADEDDMHTGGDGHI
jgi:hypothetical protein